MGNRFIWQERYNIGIETIDKEHKKLFSIMNKLLTSQAEEEKGKWACREGIKYFKEHALKHFTDEEVYMASVGYAGFETHRRLHDNFRKKTLPALERELNQTNYSKEAIDHFLSVCAGWLIGHTLTEDRAITGKDISKWERTLPEEEHTAMKQVILYLLKDMFQLKAQVVSECYGGEKFGKGIYYRLAYGQGKEKKWEIILVFEEKLIINTTGSIMGNQSKKVNVMLMNATRIASRQFTERIKEHFQPDEPYELLEENLLSYEQFQRKFEEYHPKFSLLFDTGAGYFAYCIISPDQVATENGVPIKTENAMVEVKKYLDKNKETLKQISKKHKILLVDDSELIRYAMKGLLEQDYEIAMADSGLSAIRCITLDRPDLVLLDYEMPICDGRQVLGMIRSEKEFADIPVIFLTNRTDKESVQKVISLKPAGYLLKTLQPTSIKKEIDDYFKKKVG